MNWNENANAKKGSNEDTKEKMKNKKEEEMCVNLRLFTPCKNCQ